MKNIKVKKPPRPSAHARVGSKLAAGLRVEIVMGYNLSGHFTIQFVQNYIRLNPSF